MLSSLEYQILRAVVNKGAKKLYKAIYELRAGDYLVAIRKT